jgi:hypothetical protein
MEIELNAINNPQVRVLYMLWWPQHRIICDFYHLLPEETYDYRMVDTLERKADSPRESLAHILYVELVYLNGVRSGRLEFKSMGTEHYIHLHKEQLLAEMVRIDGEIYAYLTAGTFDSAAPVACPWGQLGALDTLFFLKDHDILHIGWNLALMDHLQMPRFASLCAYWGP